MTLRSKKHWLVSWFLVACISPLSDKAWASALVKVNGDSQFSIGEKSAQKGYRRRTPFTREQYESTIAQLDSLVKTKDRAGIVKVGDQVEREWGSLGGDNYGRAILEVSNLLANTFWDHQLSQSYVSKALAHSNTLSLRLTMQLLEFLERDVSFGISRTQWERERSSKAQLWLLAWQRLEREINRNFDFSDRALLHVAPPWETGLPSGAAPEAIKDATLRARYEAALAVNAKKAQEYNRQFDLRYLDTRLPKSAEGYLVRAYSEPPYNRQELNRYLVSYGFNKQVRERILRRIINNTSQVQK